jgi:AraC-like DNA-binding protein/uncharacterized cupin superfamily protein
MTAPPTSEKHHGPNEPAFFSGQIAEARRFFLRLRPPWPAGFNVVCGGVEHCTSDYHITRDDFPYVAVELVAQGQGSLVLKNRSYALTAGMVFAYGPGVAHEIYCDHERPMTKYFVAFAGRQVARKLISPCPRSGEVVQSAAPENVVEVFEQLISSGKQDSPFHERICNVIGEFLLLRIAESTVPLGTIDTEAFGTFQRCREWADQNYRRVESLPHFASECCVHGGYLCRLFKRYAHRSPWQYVLHLKMREAAQRLQVPEVRVRDVASEFGFKDPYQFSRTFHHVLGVRPRTFIRLQRREN